jgi:peptidoglycan hydrolase-like protein with peptidoglycan-binding domain
MSWKKVRLLSTVTAGGLVLAGITVVGVTGTGHPGTHAALTAKMASSQSVTLDNCPTMAEGYPPGGCVIQLQTELNADNNTTMPVDGVFGPQTKAAVITFQQNHNIVPADGIAGPQTKAALDNPGASPTVAPSPAASTPVLSDPANTPATASGLTPLPGPAATDNGGIITCPGALQLIEPLWWNPQVVTDAGGQEFVEAVAGVDTRDVGCGDLVKVTLQTKVCGTFGCNYKDVTSATFANLPMNGEEIFPALKAPLRSGTNRYRLEMTKTTFVVDGDDDPAPGFAGPVAERESEYSTGVQLTS